MVKNANKRSLFDAFLNELRILTSSDSSKGIFKPPKSTKSKESIADEQPKESSSSSNESKAQTPPSKSSSSSSASKPPPDWNFGMFGPSPSAGPKGSNSSQGRPIGGEQNPDQNKMLMYGALGFIVVAAALTYFELGYKEISWKDFVNKSVSLYYI
jgi:hypothetical protein